MEANRTFRATIDVFPSMPGHMNRNLKTIWETARENWDEAQRLLAAGASPAAAGQYIKKANRELSKVKRGLGLGKGKWTKSPLGQNWGCGCITCIGNTPHGKGAVRERDRKVSISETLHGEKEEED
jgi:hypothetical protein